MRSASGGARRKPWAIWASWSRRWWTSFYVAHELIHYRQAESLGNLAVATKPEWLIEGMAYALSGDPRHPLGEPFEQWRSRFEAWHAGLGARGLWEAAREVR